MNAITHDILGLKGSTEVRFEAPVSGVLPPRSAGHAALRALIHLIARKSGQFAYRWDAGDVRFSFTDHDMLAAHDREFENLGISSSDRIEITNSPVQFDVTTPEGAKRTIELTWDSVNQDMMAQPPHTKPYGPRMTIAIAAGASAALWCGIYHLTYALGWL